jgi:hypothetical protein
LGNLMRRRMKRYAAALVTAVLCINHAFAADIPGRSPETAESNAQPASVMCGGYYGANCPSFNAERTRLGRLEVWGFIELPVYATGTRMAPNGVYFDPLFVLSSNLNIGLLPDKKLYVFTDASVWMQRPGVGITNGNFDSKSLVGGNGEDFRPGMFVRAYVIYDLPFLNSYLYGDAKVTAEQLVTPRLLELDAGWAARPFEQTKNLEFRLGADVTADVVDGVTRELVYGSVRLAY